MGGVWSCSSKCKDKSTVGRGAIEGVIGPGAANNSKDGGTLLTTVAFGVPASSSMAILLGAFILLGLVPGPDMLTKYLHVTFLHGLDHRALQFRRCPGMPFISETASENDLCTRSNNYSFYRNFHFFGGIYRQQFPG